MVVRVTHVQPNLAKLVVTFATAILFYYFAFPVSIRSCDRMRVQWHIIIPKSYTFQQVLKRSRYRPKIGRIGGDRVSTWSYQYSSSNNVSAYKPTYNTYISNKIATIVMQLFVSRGAKKRRRRRGRSWRRPFYELSEGSPCMYPFSLTLKSFIELTNWIICRALPWLTHHPPYQVSPTRPRDPRWELLPRRWWCQRKVTVKFLLKNQQPTEKLIAISSSRFVSTT